MLQAHRLHDNRKPVFYKCDFCFTTLQSRRHYRNHLVFHHGADLQRYRTPYGRWDDKIVLLEATELKNRKRAWQIRSASVAERRVIYQQLAQERQSEKVSVCSAAGGKREINFSENTASSSRYNSHTENDNIAQTSVVKATVSQAENCTGYKPVDFKASDENSSSSDSEAVSIRSVHWSDRQSDTDWFEETTEEAQSNPMTEMSDYGRHLIAVATNVRHNTERHCVGSGHGAENQYKIQSPAQEEQAENNGREEKQEAEIVNIPPPEAFRDSWSAAFLSEDPTRPTTISGITAVADNDEFCVHSANGKVVVNKGVDLVKNTDYAMLLDKDVTYDVNATVDALCHQVVAETTVFGSEPVESLARRIARNSTILSDREIYRLVKMATLTETLVAKRLLSRANVALMADDSGKLALATLLSDLSNMVARPQ